MAKQIAEKKPKIKSFKTLNIAFDVSTTKTGFAIIADDAPFILQDGRPSVGSFEMIKKEHGTKKSKEYQNYGDKMTHGSQTAINGIKRIVYYALNRLNEEKQLNDDFNISNINLVFEVSEIPNFGRNTGQTLTTTRKLALYTGAVLQAVWGTIENSFYHFSDKVSVKLIKPTEWQTRYWSKEELDTEKQVEKQNKRKASKTLSLKFANQWLKNYGFDETEDDDMADAINIARKASEVRDNLFAKGMAKQKKTDIKAIESSIRKLETKLAEYKQIAIEAKSIFQDNVLWAFTIDKEALTGADKAKHTKFSKWTPNDLKDKELEFFLTPAQQRNFKRWQDEVNEKKKQIILIRGKNVIRN